MRLVFALAALFTLAAGPASACDFGASLFVQRQVIVAAPVVEVQAYAVPFVQSVVIQKQVVAVPIVQKQVVVQRVVQQKVIQQKQVIRTRSVIR